MTIQFKNMGSSEMNLRKDSTGIIWISITDSVFTQQMPLSNTDINNLITTLEYLKRLQPENIQEDSFPSSNPTTNDYIDSVREREGLSKLRAYDGIKYVTSTDPNWNNVSVSNSSVVAQSLIGRDITINKDSFRHTTNNISKNKVTE